MLLYCTQGSNAIRSLTECDYMHIRAQLAVKLGC